MMGLIMARANFNEVLEELAKKYVIYAPKKYEGEGTFSDTHRVRYGEIKCIEEIEFNEKSSFSYKEVLLPITQTLFFFTETEVKEASMNEQNLLIFLRSCDLHAVRRLDEIYLRNGFEDIYYKKFREKAKFVVMGCEKSFNNCFCVDMGTNTCDHYEAYIHLAEDQVAFDIKCEELLSDAKLKAMETTEVTPKFVTENPVHVEIPEKLDLRIIYSDMWEEYSERCIACGRCNFVCPTCTCFTMQDIFYQDNHKCGERRRVWASCQVNGYTDMAGGHKFRENKGQRMRFKVMHKIYDFKKRNGYHMCVGCGRCDDVCPEYISFSNCINKLGKAMDEVE
ncbi:anaerobic sulfite reductase subunit A [Turicibacter bilis]|uniref:Anaerobic sulfite reductase subunit A n=2 Tax=Turicibacteraceae TaxID=2810281 RepID=A0ABY5JMV7_9FIRM|nr:anaerobic sulfite reductase subunit A [Turicibacter bilis]